MLHQFCSLLSCTFSALQHSQCFDALAAYYQDDVRLFGLPTCR